MPAFLGLMPRWAWVLLGAALLMAAFYFALDAYGDSRYDAGKADEKATWKQAEAEFLKKAGEASTKADKQAAARAAEYAADVADERKKIDDAVKEGTSPLDAIFGTAD